MTPLIDADVLRYELGFSSEFVDEGTGEVIPREWDFVEELIDGKISFICEEVGATGPPVLFLTKDRRTALVQTRGKDEKFLPNFRENISTTKVYKGERKNAKPIHYSNITAYLIGAYNCVVADGLEADDLMAFTQTHALQEGGETVICSRDKDLRQVPGMQYSWECGRQPSFGPINASWEGKLRMRKDKVIGTGLSFFHYQLLVGDSVDNIPGLKGWGPKKAYNLLQAIPNPADQFREVLNLYREQRGGDAEDYLREQGQLLWLVREFGDKGEPVIWDIPYHERNLNNTP